MSNAMVLQQQQVESTKAFEPSSIEEAYRLAKLLVASKLLPRGVGSPEAAFAIIATGREMGLTAMQSLRSIHVIEGKPTLSADLMCALVKGRRDICKYFRLVTSTALVATYETLREGEPEPTRMSFTIEEAKAAGLVGKDNWRKYPAAMLRARCITALARAVYPDLAMGLYDEDEVTPLPRPVSVVEMPRESVESRDPDLTTVLEASLETPSWPEWVAAWTTAIAATTTKEELLSVWSDAYRSAKELDAPHEHYSALVQVKDEKKAFLK